MGFYWKIFVYGAKKGELLFSVEAHCEASDLEIIILNTKRFKIGFTYYLYNHKRINFWDNLDYFLYLFF